MLTDTTQEMHVQWLNSEEAPQKIHPDERAALAHYNLAHIQPCYGSTSRLLMNLVLMQARKPPIIILKEQSAECFAALIFA